MLLLIQRATADRTAEASSAKKFVSGCRLDVTAVAALEVDRPDRFFWSSVRAIGVFFDPLLPGLFLLAHVFHLLDSAVVIDRRPFP